MLCQVFSYLYLLLLLQIVVTQLKIKEKLFFETDSSTKFKTLKREVETTAKIAENFDQF